MLPISSRHYAMPLQAFSFPCPETRFFKAGSFIYKFKIRGGSSFRGEKNMGGNCLNQQLEEIIRTVLGNLDSLQPFSSSHFIVFPYRKRREGASKVMCKHGERKLRAYPFTLILYLEKNMQNEEAKQVEEKLSSEKYVAQQFPPVSEPQSKRHKSDSPLEEAILKRLIKDMEAEGKVSVVGKVPRGLTNPSRNQVSTQSEEVGLQVKCILGQYRTWERRRVMRRKKMQTLGNQGF
ncbi:membrane-anchored junction protein isoform X4 [Perca fluviatilis]|uniref:membrane-anchored junction protein isoform X4 n=1 Tax=Perca fluviatilis TaxID=8168 RepID=UPI001962712C|nr:membrane-anchored junction protein isoform X4 [Perca fluviatilis]